MSSRYRLVLVVWAMQFVNYFDRINISVAGPTMMKALSIDPGQFGMILAAFTLGYATMQIPGGFLADRFGAKALLIGAPLVWSVFTGLTGLATTVAGLMAVRFCFGLAEGSSNASCYKLVGDNFDSKDRSRANGIWLTALALGPATVAPVAAWLLQRVGWERLFFYFTIPGVLIAAIIYSTIPAQKPKPTSAPAPALGDAGSLDKIDDTDLGIMKRRSTWLIFTGYLTFNVGYWGYLGWMPSYLALERNLKLAQLGYAASIPYLFGFAGLVCLAVLGSTLFHRHRAPLVTGTYVLAAIALYFTYSARTIDTCLAGLCASAFFLYGGFAPTAALLLDFGPVGRRGAFAGFINTGGQIGGLSAPLVVGFVVHATGSFQGGFLFMIGALLVSASSYFALYFVPKPAPGSNLQATVVNG
jgi:ACS family D-galactonate transporter-like MFS transporter